MSWLLRLLLGEGGFGRISVGAAMVIALGGGLGAYYVTTTAPAAGTAHLWVDQNGGSCIHSATAIEYTGTGDTNSCSSMDNAYSASGVACGDTINVKGGSYASQSLAEVVGLSGCGSDVVIQEAPSEAVTTSNITLGTNNVGPNGYDSNAPDHIKLIGFGYSGDITMHSDANFITVDGVAGGSVYIQGATNITVTNSEFGPCPSSGGSCGRMHILDAGGEEATTTSDILIEGNTIHDFLIGQAGEHWECMYNSGGANVTIRGNIFYNCETYAIMMETYAFSNGYSNWLVENNWFGRMCNNGPPNNCNSTRASAVYPKMARNTLIRFNSFSSGTKVTNEGGTSSNVRVVANILGDNVCDAPYTYNYNVFTQATGCAADANDTALNLIPYIDDSDQAAMNYHLEGAVGSTGADNYVPTSVTDSGLATDFDGQSRPINTNRDAGSDER